MKVGENDWSVEEYLTRPWNHVDVFIYKIIEIMQIKNDWVFVGYNSEYSNLFKCIPTYHSKLILE